MTETALIISATTEAELAAALVASGILQPHEGGYTAVHPTIHSPLPPDIAGMASAFVRFQTVDQATADAVLAQIPLAMQNRPAAPLRMVAGGIAPRAEAWPAWAIRFGLTLMNRRADWETAITAIATKVDATNAEKLLPDRWDAGEWLTLEEPWVNRIVAQMRTTLGWTVAQRDTFLTQLKNRATAQVAAAQ